MPRHRPLSAEESIDARRALRERAEQARLPWSQGVRALRKALGMTQAGFARAFKLTVRQVSELENGAANPTVQTLERLSKPLGLTVGFIPAEAAPPGPRRRPSGA